MFGYKKKCEPVVTYTVISDVETELITVEEAKAFMGIDFPDFDSIIPIFIKAAREEAEKYTGLSIGEREIQLAGDYTDENAYMPFAPYQAYDEEGLQAVGYDAETLPGDIKLALLNGIHVAFENRTSGLNFGSMLTLLAKSRRRVGL